MVKILLPLSCLLAGLLLASSGFLLAEKIEEKNRFNACREQDYSFLSLTGSDEERFGRLVVRRENGMACCSSSPSPNGKRTPAPTTGRIPSARRKNVTPLPPFSAREKQMRLRKKEAASGRLPPERPSLTNKTRTQDQSRSGVRVFMQKETASDTIASKAVLVTRARIELAIPP